MSRNMIVAVIILIIVGVAAVIAFSLFYKPEEGTTGLVSVIDDVGRNVTIANFPPERIVSMAPSCTEILYALGLGDKIVGVDEYVASPSFNFYEAESSEIEPFLYLAFHLLLTSLKPFFLNLENALCIREKQELFDNSNLQKGEYSTN